MATYAIGDIQGCYLAFERLLKKINFNPSHDTLWITGDMVNRGPQSLEVLRFLRGLGKKHKIVLGNHDLHLLAVAYGVRKLHSTDTLDPILSAPDRDDLLNWMRHLPLLVYDKKTGYVMSHAGLAAAWDIEQAQRLAHEVEAALRGKEPELFLKHMYGNEPDHWDNGLLGMDRLRCITNYLTRMRLCYPDGRLDMSYKGVLKDKPHHLIPWFDVKNRVNANTKIIFGHWASLGGKTDVPNVFALDTGCVWGECLTAMCLEDGKLFDVKCG